MEKVDVLDIYTPQVAISRTSYHHMQEADIVDNLKNSLTQRRSASLAHKVAVHHFEFRHSKALL
jgi:hypothetical protein